MTPTLDFVRQAHRVLEGPIDVGTEQRWRIELADGTRALVGQLAPDLARDEPIRRRYVRDTERLRDLQVHSLAPTLEIGPLPDPRDPRAIAPWRMRVDPVGEPLSRWLARAPAPLDEIATVFSAIADAVHAVHTTGTVLRDLRPDQIVHTAEGRVVLTDVGLARVDVLSSHTASSLLLQGSTYCAPEQLMSTAIDQRSDVWALGVMMWQALTGELPFGDGPALVRENRELPPLPSIRGDVPPSVDALVRACLRDRPDGRPASVIEIAWVLRGGGGTTALERATTTCQHCDRPLRVGQRLCVWCGRVAVRFFHAAAHESGYALDLLDLSEEAAPLAWLEDFIASTAQAPARKPEFVIGSIHMYSEEERARRIRLPARLYSGLTRETAEALHRLTREHGLRTRVITPQYVRTSAAATVTTLVAVAAGSIAMHFLGLPFWWLLVPGLIAVFVLLVDLSNRISNRRTAPEFRLRPVPAALPASDPLVARLAALLVDDPPGDVREVVAELALVVQRLVDHRASFLGDTRELDVLTAPIEPLVAAVEDLAGRLRTIAAEMRELDEGALVRAIGASEARGEPAVARHDLLVGLDRLRTLEDLRAAAFHRLLEARALLERTVELGLGVADPVREQERQVALALATLTS